MIFTLKGNAQKSLSSTYGLMCFLGNSNSYYSSEMETGLTLSGKYNIDNAIRIGLNFGYFFNNDEILKVSATPLTCSIENSFFSSKTRPYIGASFGIYRLAYRFLDAFSKNPNPQANHYFGIAPIIGIEYDFSKHFFVNTNCKLNYIITKENGYGENSKSMEVSVGVGYKFN
jgi:outer membrane protein W